jgi:phosphoribosyl 1,2-cyclic phosphate phosphodiesterase
MTTKVKILGSGNSSGVPAIENFWGNCDPDNPKNRRSRPCVAVYNENTTLIVDTGPDFKEQFNASGLERVDAVLYSHAHGDHVNGIDELRVLNFIQNQKTPVYAGMETLKDLQNRFSYMFYGSDDGLYSKVIDIRCIVPDDFYTPMGLRDLEFSVFPQDHGTCESLGIRTGDTAYSPDMVDLGPKTIEHLKGIKTWIVDGSGYNSGSNPVHASIKKIYDLNDHIGAEKVYLAHLSPYMDYDQLMKELKSCCEPSYDGLEIDVND